MLYLPLVDDEKLNSFVVAEYLKLAGYRDLFHTDDPLRVLSLAYRVRPDVILLDIHMRSLNGLAILQQIRADKALARTPVVILTASTDEGVKARALKLGATDFLNKPIHKEQLLGCLRNIMPAKADKEMSRRLPT
jgi:CheY-like chemotaxis protein